MLAGWGASDVARQWVSSRRDAHAVESRERSRMDAGRRRLRPKVMQMRFEFLLRVHVRWHPCTFEAVHVSLLVRRI